MSTRANKNSTAKTSASELLENGEANVEMKALNETALELGAKSSKSASEVAVSLDELAANKTDENQSEEIKEETVPSEEGTVFIYCGPTNSYVSRYTSYRNGYPIHLKEHFEKFPTLKALFIEPKNFAEFEQNVAQPETIENIYFAEARKYFSKAVNK